MNEFRSVGKKKNGKCHGIWKTYHDKFLWMKKVYDNGLLIELSSYEEDMETEEIYETIYTIKNGLKHGKAKTINDKGECIKVDWYFEDKKMKRLRFCCLNTNICKLCMGEDFERAFSGAKVCKLKIDYEDEKNSFDFKQIEERKEIESKIPEKCPYYTEHMLKIKL